MKIFAVDVEITKSMTIYVAGETKDEAKADAEEMNLDSPDFGLDTETNLYVYETNAARLLPDLDLVWSGGPDGDWVSVTELDSLEEKPAVLPGQERLL